MQTLILDRDDINNPLHPNMWEAICDQLGFSPLDTGRDYPDQIEICVASARDVDAFVDA